MKTLCITPDLFEFEGGIARIMRLYLKALCDIAGDGDEVRCVALADRGDTRRRTRAYVGQAFRGIDNCEGNKWLYFVTILWRGSRADRLICGHLHHLILARFAAVFRPGLKYYLVAHGIEVWRPYTFMEKAALRDAHRILCVSEYTRRQMLRFAPFLASEKLIVIPNTYDDRFEPVALSVASYPPVRHPRILVVSRLVSADPYKGVDTMIEAMPAVLRQFSTAQLRIVGGGDDLPRLEAIVNELGLGEAVHFTGIIEDEQLRREYQECDIFALPSRKEGFGLVYLEAMSYGKPCLAARAGGAPEVVNRDVGVLVEYANTEQIAVAVSDLIRHPRDPQVIRRHKESFCMASFRSRLIAALSI